MYLPPSLRRRGAFCLHVSDTPSRFFTSLQRLIALLEPPLVIHTGDLVDDVKLGLYPSLLPDYRRGVRELARLLRHCPGRVVVTLGNHDDGTVAWEALPFCDAYDAVASLSFKGLSFQVAHYASMLTPQPGDMALFGHDGTLSQQRDGVTWLNGQLTLNLIDWRSGEVHELAYPRFVDEARQNLRRYKM